MIFDSGGLDDDGNGGRFLFILGFAVAAGYETLRAHPMNPAASEDLPK
jgi:hypothetical protein